MQFIVFPTARRLGIDKCAVCNDQTTEERTDPKAALNFILHSFSKRSLDTGFSTHSLMNYGYNVRDKGYSVLLSVLIRLEQNNDITADELLSAYYDIPLDTIRNSRPRRPSIPAKIRYGYLNATGSDGLRPVGTKPKTREEIQEIYKEALRNKEKQ